MAGRLVIKSEDWLYDQLREDERKAVIQADFAVRHASSGRAAGNARKWDRRAEQLAALRADLAARPWAALEIAQQWQDVTRGGVLHRRREVFLDWDPPTPPGADAQRPPWDAGMTEQLRQLIEDRWSSIGMLDIQRTDLTERSVDRQIWTLLDTQIQYRHPPRERVVLKALRTPRRCAVTLGFTATGDRDQVRSYRFTFVAQGNAIEAVDVEPKWMAQDPQWGNLVDDEDTMPADGGAEAAVSAPIESFLADDLRNAHDEVLANIKATRDLITTSPRVDGVSTDLASDELGRLENTLDDSLRLYRRIGADDQVMPLTGRTVHDEMAHQLGLMLAHVERLRGQILEPDVNAFAANSLYLADTDRPSIDALDI